MSEGEPPAGLEPFVVPADLEKFLRRTLDEDAADMAVEAASDEIRGVVKQTISEATSEDVLVRPRGTVLFLAELPVDPDSVSIEVDDEPFDEFDLDPHAGIVCRTDGHAWPSGGVLVTYTHGYPEGHPKLRVARRVCLYAAARIYSNPEQMMQKRRGDYTASYGSSTVEVAGLTTWERTLLRSYYPSSDHAI